MSSSQVRIRWYGQACVVVTSPLGTSVMIDPFDEAIGHEMPSVEPQAVVTTHDHYDHANVEGVRGRPKVLRGLTPEGQWAGIDERVGDVRIRTVGTWHDEVRGAKRGLNNVVVLEIGDLRIAHCGDLGHLLTDEQVQAIGPVDVLLVPVGGVYTVDAAEARKVVKQLRPRRAVIPMHFRTPPLKIQLEPVEPFLAGLPGVQRLAGNTYDLPVEPPADEPAGPETIVLDWKTP